MSTVPSPLVQFTDSSAGAVFLPNDGRRRGLVVICHERYGLAQHTLDLAQRLANSGWVAIAPDFYADYKGDREAIRSGSVIVDLDDVVIQKHLGAAIGYATGEQRVSPDRVVVMGVCLSGSYGL